MTTVLRRTRPRSVRSSLYAKRERTEEPFYATFFKVGSTLLALCTVTYLVFVVRITSRANEHDGVPYREHLLVKHDNVPEKEAREDIKVTTFPMFTLTATSENDVFGIAETHLSQVKQDAPQEILQFLDAAEKLRSDFADRYGGKVSARALIERSLVVLKKNESDILSNAMAYRIQQVLQNKGVLEHGLWGWFGSGGFWKLLPSVFSIHYGIFVN